MEKPKIRGHENTAKVHPLWERIKQCFDIYFNGDERKEVIWQRKDSLSCNPVALEKQALGCLVKAMAMRHGRQKSSRGSADICFNWIDEHLPAIHRRINACAQYVEIRTGFGIGHYYEHPNERAAVYSPKGEASTPLVGTRRVDDEQLAEQYATKEISSRRSCGERLPFEEGAFREGGVYSSLSSLWSIAV